ncbi:AsmA family protein [Halomonas sediminis]
MTQGSSRKRHWWWLAPLILVVLVIALVQLMSWNVFKPLIVERIEAATGRSVAIEGDVKVDFLPRPAISLHDVRIGNPAWAASPQMLKAQRVSVSPSLGDLLDGEFVLDAVAIDGPTLTLEQRRDAPGNWVFPDMQDGEETQQPSAADDPTAPPVAIRRLSVTDAQVHYRAAGADTPVAMTIPSLQIERAGDGLDTSAAWVFDERRFTLQAHTDSLEALLGDAASFGGEISLGADDDRLSGTFRLPEFPSLASLQADAELSVASTADWAQWLGLPVVELGALQVAMRLVREGSEWRLSEIDASALDSRLTGDLEVKTADEAPRLNGRLDVTQIDLAAWREALPEGEETAGLAIPVLPDLRGKIALSVGRLALDQWVLEDLEAEMHLAEHTLALEPITFAVTGGNIEASIDLNSNPDTLSAEARISLQELDMEALGIALEPGDAASGDTLVGDVALRLSPLEQRGAFARETLLANLQIDNGRFSYSNQEVGSDLDLVLATGEAPPLRLSMTGTFRNNPLTMEVQGGPLPELVALDEDYRLAAEASSGNLQARVDTTLASLLDPATLSADVMLQAPGAGDLEAWAGPALPPLPEFRLAGRLERDNEHWSATGLEGEIGGARVAGSVEFRNAERPVVQADLEAGRIVLARLLPDGAETNGEAEPDSLLAPLRGFDGQVALRADSLVLPDGTVLQDLAMDAGFDAGTLDVDPLRFGLAGGLGKPRHGNRRPVAGPAGRYLHADGRPAGQALRRMAPGDERYLARRQAPGPAPTVYRPNTGRALDAALRGPLGRYRLHLEARKSWPGGGESAVACGGGRPL